MDLPVIGTWFIWAVELPAELYRRGELLPRLLVFAPRKVRAAQIESRHKIVGHRRHHGLQVHHCLVNLALIEQEGGLKPLRFRIFGIGLQNLLVLLIGKIGLAFPDVNLDLMLPKVPGLQVLKKILTRNLTVPVLILSAKGTVDEKVAGLDAGASDYLVKPFAFAELSARIRVLLRRGAQESTTLRLADLEMNTASRTVTRAGSKIDLKLKEFSLLEFLLRNARRTVTRTMIIEHVWDIHFDSVSNVVDVHINTLRNKIDRGFSPPLIHTIRGVGYVLTDESA